MKYLILLILILTSSACSYNRSIKNGSTAGLINNIIESKQYSHMNWGIRIESVNESRVIFEHNSEKLFIPASNQKLLTAASVLDILEPEQTIPTKFYYTGTIKDSILTGDLIIQGFGDPTLSHDFYDDPREIFINWSDSIRSHGIKQIDGNLIGDDRKFGADRLGEGWMLEDIKYPFAAENGALQFNDNSLILKIIPPVSDDGSVMIEPEFISSCFTIINEITVAKDSITWLEIDRPGFDNYIYLRGNLEPSGPILTRSVSLSDPTKLFVSILGNTFVENGLRLQGRPISIGSISDYKTDSLSTNYLFGTNSLPLSRILKNMLEKSSNLQSETILKFLAVTQDKIGSTENSKVIMQEFLAKLEILPGTYRISDASGLSRYNLISAEQMTRALKYMLDSDHSDVWMDIIPVTGNFSRKNGLSFGKSKAGNIRAKTGTMSNIRCLSGYVILPEDTIVFSFLVNSHLLSSWKIDLLAYTILVYALEDHLDR